MTVFHAYYVTGQHAFSQSEHSFTQFPRSELSFPAQYIGHMTGEHAFDQSERSFMELPNLSKDQTEISQEVYRSCDRQECFLLPHNILFLQSMDILGRLFWAFPTWMTCPHSMSNQECFEHALNYEIRGDNFERVMSWAFWLWYIVYSRMYFELEWILWTINWPIVWESRVEFSKKGSDLCRFYFCEIHH